MYLSPEDLMSQLEVSASFSVAACETVSLHPEYKDQQIQDPTSFGLLSDWISQSQLE